MKRAILYLLFFLYWGIPLLPAQTSIPLFNGKNLSGWHMDVPDLDKNPDLRIPFVVRQGLLVSLGTPEGHLITDKVYSDYRLEVEYRFPGEPGNCGVLVHASTPRALYGMFPKSLEVQMQHGEAGDFWCIVEDIQVPNMVERRGPKEKWGIVEGKNRRIRNLTDDSEKALGEWNRMIIECKADRIEVWLNGDLVNSGFDCTVREGQIAIQAEGSEVEFRKILLSPLELSEEDSFAKNWTLRPLTFSDSTHDGYPSWSPDGKWLVYSSGTRDSCFTRIIPSSGGSSQLALKGFAQHARWSPNGEYLVFDSDFGRQIATYSFQDERITFLQTGNFPIEKSGMPCWSTDGEKIAFSSKGKICVQNMADGQTEQVYANPRYLAIPACWINEDQILADLIGLEDTSDRDLWVISTKDGTATKLLELEGRQMKPEIAPGGDLVVFASDHAGNVDLWITNLRGATPVQISFFEGDLMNPGYDLEACWSPDSKQIAFSSTREGRWSIWLIDLDLERIKAHFEKLN